MRALFLWFSLMWSWSVVAQPTSAPAADPKQTYAQASELFGKQQFLEAAQAFELGYEQFKSHPTYGPAFLYNAAIAYEQHDTLIAPALESAKRSYSLFEELLLSYPQIPEAKQDIAKQKLAELLLRWPEIKARTTDCVPSRYPFCPIPALPLPVNEPLNFCVEKKLLCRVAIGAAASLGVAGSMYGYRIIGYRDANTGAKR